MRYGIKNYNLAKVKCSCGSVVEHCVSSAKRSGLNFQGTHTVKKNV